MSTASVYVPRDSPVHRLRAGRKLLVLAAVAAASALVREPWQVGVLLGLALALYAVARLPGRTALAQVRPVLWLLVALGVFQWLVDGWARAVVVVGVLLALVLLAALVSLTTRTSDIVDVVVRLCAPLRRWGVEPERVGLLVALGIRSVPVVVELARQVRDAQRARGLTASPVAFAVPLVVHSLRHADRLGEALVARGVED